MSDILTALRAEFSAEVEPPIPLGSTHLNKASRALKHAVGQVQLVRSADELSADHARSLNSAAAALHAAARSLELVSHGVQHHLDHGYSTWRGSAGEETPLII